MTSVSLYVELKAKPGKESELATFLTSARGLAMAEPGTPVWFAVQFDHNTFAIFDAFNSVEDRKAHLGGQIAAALMARAGDLLAAAPEIREATVLADKIVS